MVGNRRRLAAALLLAAIVGACGSGGVASATASTPVAAATTTTVPSRLVAGATDTAAAPSGGTALGGPVAKGGDYCGLLGPGDFAAAGIGGAKTPVENFDDSGNYYCVYAGDSGATGGIEFDAFVGSPDATYQAMAAGAGILTAEATGELPGVDKAGTILNGPGGMAGIAVCKGQFCFAIDAPTGSGTRAQLIALATLVLQRGSGLTG
jgi:hypothetical protein